MKVGDLIVGDPGQVLMLSGYEVGLIIGEKVGLIIGEKLVEPEDPYETQYRVMWECGKISYPSKDYLECYRVVNEGR